MNFKQDSFSRFVIAAWLAAPLASAQLTWDANGTGASQTNGAGTWHGANLWWNGSTNQNWLDGSNAIFGGPSTAGGTVTIASAVSAGSLTFNTFTGTYTLQGTAQSLTQSGGITISATAGNLTMRGTATTGLLTLAGTGGITMNGSGLLILRENLVLSYTGSTVINSGTVMVSGNKGTGNFVLNGGMLTDYYQALTAFSGLGIGNNQIQVYGSSGFGGGNGTSTWRIGTSGSTLIWGALGDGAATGFFNPTTLRFLAPGADNMGTSIYGQALLDNGIDLNGAARTVQVPPGSGTRALTSSSGVNLVGSFGRVSGVISGSGGSLIKTGGGNLVLSAANTYGGGTTINQGSLRFTSLTAMPPSGTVTVNTGGMLTIEAGGAGDWTAGTSGVGTLGGLFAGLGSAGTSTVSFVGDATLGLDTSANLNYAGDIPNLGNNLSITKTGASNLTLTGNNSYSGRTWVHTGTLFFNSIGDVGAGSSALGAPATVGNGTISVGSDGNNVTLAYTGSGHSTNRIIHLAAASNSAIIDASGTGPLTLTSSLTAASGAKTLTLTGSNIAANTLGTTAIPGLAEVLTITKSGVGTWWVSGFSSPKNAWTISAGTLVANGTITTGDQNFTVSGGTLAGVGPIILQSGKTLTVQAAGSLSPANSITGTMAVTGILNISAMLSGTGKLNFQIGAPASSDKIAVTGSAQIGSGVMGFNDFTFTDMGGITPGTYVLISTSGGITGNLDPTNRSGMIGSINGTLQINGNNVEWSTDQDLDGIPDVYELAYTSPSSATAFNAADDLDSDGSSNLQEYIAGTNPNNSDSDGDGFMDGIETKTGTWTSASNTGTDPLVFDTDGDGLRDGYETNTGIYVDPSNPGTNPNKQDSDDDALNDIVETNTGSYVSKTNTGTNPNASDTDNDGAGDWYEITASFTSPFLSAEKPNVPYPLPDPDGSTGATNKKVRVYIMSGQSNMLGMGTVAGTGDGTLETMTRRQNKFPNLIDGSGNYIPRQDVRYRGVISGIANGPLAPGQGSSSNLIGPELGFGHVMGWYHDAPVLLIKSSIGNRGLGWDILPPGSARFTFGTNTYPAYGESPSTIPLSSSSWVTASGSEGPNIWFAGKQYDDYFVHESDMGARPWVSGVAYPSGCQVMHNGVPYVSILAHTAAAASQPGAGTNWATFWSLYSITNVVDILDNWTAEYGGSGKPFAGRDFEIAGFVWWQGEKDGGDLGHATRYEQNLVRLISTLRNYYSNRYPGKVVPNAPFVLATLGEAALSNISPATEVAVRNAHFAVDSATGSNPQTNVKTVYSYPLSEGGSGNGHYNNRAGTYMLVGDALGRAMVELESTSGANTYSSWIAGFPSVPSILSGFDQDADGDGIDNGAENFFGTNPGIGSSGLVSLATGANTFTFTHPQNASPANGVSATYRWSKDLVTFRNGGQTDGDGTTVTFNAVTSAGITTVTATITGTATAKLFVDVKVTQN